MQRIRSLHQDRAFQTAETLARAAHELMQKRPLDEIPVAEIARRAGVSIGAFYARFGCKEALLDWLCQDRLRGEGDRILAELSTLQASGADLREMVKRYVEMSAAFFQRNRALLREVMRLAYGTTDEEALRETVLVNREVDRAFVEVLLSRREQILHPEPERVVVFVPGLVAAVLRSAILLGPTLQDPGPGQSTEERSKELVEWVLTVLKSRPS